MFSISINFNHPWLLFVLIPFVAFTFIPYFTLSRKYRKTRNRITSMVLHLVVSFMATFLLTGMTFTSSKTNLNNELILLVDKSDSSLIAEEKRDTFIETVIEYASYESIEVGVVTFGYDCEYAVPLTRKYNEIMDKYYEAELPDTKATDIAQALTYTKDLFDSESNKKIVIVSDFKETDENAKSVIKSVVASGITVDTAYINTALTEGIDDIEIVSAKLPEYHINRGDTCGISIDVYSNTNADITIRLKDNDVADEEDAVTHVTPGVQTITFTHTFLTDGLHALDFEILDAQDTLKENDKYITYLNVESFDKLLILEHTDESDYLKSVLTEGDAYSVDVLNVISDELPAEAIDLCKYDEIILNNIAVSDLPEGYESVLYEYVNVYGGGLLTTGGQDELDSSLSHAYNREDLAGTLLHQMLPVQAINYTPPVGVIIIIDTSGSMSSVQNGSSLLDWAKAGAVSCLNSLSERDYIGIMTLSSNYDTILELTPRTQESKILRAIDSIEEAAGGTEFAAPIERAGLALRALKAVDKKHIIIVSDGETPESGVSDYETFAKKYYDSDKITISVVGVNISGVPSNRDAYENDNIPVDSIGTSSAYMKMVRLTKIANGKLYVTNNSDASEIITKMREDVDSTDIKSLNFVDFNPQAKELMSNIYKDIELINDDKHINNLPFVLSGFHGVKIKASADLLMVGDFNVPLYASWKQGKGSVGSFMSDLNGVWSSDMMSDPNGKQLIYNIINSLTPVESIRPKDINVQLREDNYSTYMSIYTSLNEGERITAEIVNGGNSYSLNELPVDQSIRVLRELGVYTLLNLSADSNYSRCRFVIREPGVYVINVNKLDAEGNVLSTTTIHKTFSYSKEFEYYEEEPVDITSSIKQISTLGKGVMVEDIQDPHEIIDSFETVIYRKHDPRVFYEIVAILAFLLDIAVRKFKFLWPHEIIRKYKERREEK